MFHFFRQRCKNQILARPPTMELIINRNKLCTKFVSWQSCSHHPGRSPARGESDTTIDRQTDKQANEQTDRWFLDAVQLLVICKPWGAEPQPCGCPKNTTRQTQDYCIVVPFWSFLRWTFYYCSR